MGGSQPKARQLLWTISDASMQALQRAADRAFAKKMAALMAQAFPHEGQRLGGRMRATVEKGIGEALQHGVEGEPELEAYLRLWIASGYDLEKRWPGSNKVLQDGALTPAAKVGLLRQLAQ